MKDEQGREGAPDLAGTPGLRSQNLEKGACGWSLEVRVKMKRVPGQYRMRRLASVLEAKDGRRDLTHLLGGRVPGRRKHCLLSAEVSLLICGKCEDFLFPPRWW